MYKNRKLFVSFLIGLMFISLFAISVSAESPTIPGNWEYWTTSNSPLPDNNVWSFAEDSAGNIWIGTENGGVMKYDGTNYTVFDTSNSGLLSNWVITIFEDSNNNIWFGTWGRNSSYCGGLTKYDGTTWVTYTSENSDLPLNCVGAIEEDSDNNIWVSYPYIGWIGIAITKFDGSTWTNYSTRDTGYGTTVDITLDEDTGILWLGTTNGLFNYDGTTWNKYAHIPELHNQVVRQVSIDHQGSLWLRLNRKFYMFDGVDLHYPEDLGLEVLGASSLTDDVNGNIWFGKGAWHYPSRVSVYTLTSWVHYTGEDAALHNGNIRGMLVDSQGNAWFGLGPEGRGVRILHAEIPPAPPMVDANGPYTGNEGDNISLTGTGSSSNGPVSYRWDLDDDGIYETASQNPVFDASNLDGPTTTTVTLEVCDNNNLCATDTAVITILNSAPENVNAGPDQTVLVNTQVYFEGSFTDSGVLDTHTIEWTFESGVTENGTLTPSYTFTTPGTYPVYLTITDDDGGVGSAQIVVTVQTPQEASEDVIDDIDELVDNGALNNGQGNALISQLEAIIAKIDKGQTNAATNQLEAFISQVTAYINAGTLSLEEGQPLIYLATQILASLQ